MQSGSSHPFSSSQAAGYREEWPGTCFWAATPATCPRLSALASLLALSLQVCTSPRSVASVDALHMSLDSDDSKGEVVIYVLMDPAAVL